MENKSWGEFAFLAGIAIAITLALFPGFHPDQPSLILALLGLIVGLLNVTAKETTNFLLASIALLLIGSAGLENLPTIGLYLNNIMINISNFVAPAAMIVALKTVVDLAKKK